MSWAQNDVQVFFTFNTICANHIDPVNLWDARRDQFEPVAFLRLFNDLGPVTMDLDSSTTMM